MVLRTWHIHPCILRILSMMKEDSYKSIDAYTFTGKIKLLSLQFGEYIKKLLKKANELLGKVILILVK